MTGTLGDMSPDREGTRLGVPLLREGPIVHCPLFDGKEGKHAPARPCKARMRTIIVLVGGN